MSRMSPPRALLDAAVFDAAWEKGHAMTLDEAIDYALEANSAQSTEAQPV